MTTIRKIVTSKIDGNRSNSTDTSEIRPYGEIAVYVGDNNKLELLMFDGVRTHLKSKVLNKGTVYGGDADSGDGAGLDTIKLIPDAELYYNDSDYGNDQYIIIDPTQPNHIHIRAGGTIDSSNAELFLGGERNHVKVSDSYDNVVISTDAGEGGLRNWIFDPAGDLTVPEGSTISPPDTDGNAGSFTIKGQTTTGSFISGGDLILEAGEGEFSNGTIFIGEGTSTTFVRLGSSTNGAIVELDGYVRFLPNASLDLQYVPLTKVSEISSENAINIDINLTDSTLRRWRFGEDGDLTFPDNTVQTTAAPPQGEYVYAFNGVDTDITITDLNFNSLIGYPEVGYNGSDTHYVYLPDGTLGQRLVVINLSTLCNLTINSNFIITNDSGPAEFIYTSIDGWIPLYGTTVVEPE